MHTRGINSVFVLDFAIEVSQVPMFQKQSIGDAFIRKDIPTQDGVSSWPICFVAIGIRAWACTLVHSLRPQPQRLAS